MIDTKIDTKCESITEGDDDWSKLSKDITCNQLAEMAKQLQYLEKLLGNEEKAMDVLKIYYRDFRK